MRHILTATSWTTDFVGEPQMAPVLSTVLVTVLNAEQGIQSVGSGCLVRTPSQHVVVATAAHNIKSRKGAFDVTSNPSLSILIGVTDDVSTSPVHRYRAVS